MLTSLHIKDYRNIQDMYFEFSSGTHLIIGNNGQGKTNILESIYAFSIGKAFRAKTLYETIGFDKESLHLYAQTKDTSLEIHAANTPKKQTRYLHAGNKCSYMKFLGNFSSVLFSPADLIVLRGSPSVRRNYLDSLIIRLDTSYAYVLQKYEQTLRQRNALLKKISENPSNENQLDFWDETLAEKAFFIWEQRVKVIKEFEIIVQKTYKNLSFKDHIVNIEYILKGTPENFIQELKDQRKKDVIVGSTTLGPHRDNILFYLNEKLAADFASQGEIRSLMLSCTFAELEMIEKQNKCSAVLLLDDVLSELDNERQQALLDLTKNRQTFITGTSLENIDFSEKIYTIADGKLQ
jgi:DNA replication and repair protein RecF